MSEMFNPHAPATAYDHDRTIVAVLELSGKNWLLGAVAPGLSRRTKRSFEARNVEAVLWAVEQAKEESANSPLTKSCAADSILSRSFGGNQRWRSGDRTGFKTS
jgi:hypothetical protein